MVRLIPRETKFFRHVRRHGPEPHRGRSSDESLARKISQTFPHRLRALRTSSIVATT